MKKIVSLMLAFACVIACAFAFTACGDPEPTPTEDNKPVYSTSAAPFITAYNATVVKTVNASVKMTIFGETLEATYATEKNNDGTVKMTYVVEQLPPSDSDEDKIVINGEATSDTNGVFTDDYAKAFGANGVKLNLNTDKIKSFDASANVLRITVDAKDTAAVVGADLGADAVVTVTISAGVVTAITLAYTSATSGAVEIVCEYNKPIAA